MTEPTDIAPLCDSAAVSGLDQRLVVLLQERGPMTLTQIGETLWGGKRNRQAYARPAGAMIARLRRCGIVRQALAMDLGGKRDVPEDFDLCLPIPKPETMPEWEGW